MQNLRNDTNTFYDAVADYYHLFYRDWHATLQREGSALRRVFRDKNIKKVLDASCGTGTQAIALAKLNYEVKSVEKSALEGKAQRKVVTIFFGDKSDAPKMDLLLYLPAASRKPVPVIRLAQDQEPRQPALLRAREVE